MDTTNTPFPERSVESYSDALPCFPSGVMQAFLGNQQAPEMVLKGRGKGHLLQGIFIQVGESGQGKTPMVGWLQRVEHK